MFLGWFCARSVAFRGKSCLPNCARYVFPEGLEEMRVLKNQENFYAVLFAPQCGQNIAVYEKSVPQYLQGITTTSRITSRTSLSSRLELEPHPHPKPKGDIC